MTNLPNLPNLINLLNGSVDNPPRPQFLQKLPPWQYLDALFRRTWFLLQAHGDARGGKRMLRRRRY